MSSTEKFNESVGILVKAYLNGTLEYSNCYACAVGNLVAHHCGYEIYRRQHLEWRNEVAVDWYIPFSYKNVKHCFQQEQTGYSVDELRLIEKAFEGQAQHRDDGFKGLMAVCDVLAEIHGISLESKEAAKSLFVKAL